MASKKNTANGSSWEDVQVGDQVQLDSSGHVAFAGRVDARTADGEIIWVHNPVGGRRLFHVHDGFALQLAAS